MATVPAPRCAQPIRNGVCARRLAHSGGHWSAQNYEERLRRSRAWKQAHHDANREAQRKWEAANAASISARHQRFVDTHPEYRTRQAVRKQQSRLRRRIAEARTEGLLSAEA